jgi:hypothetical protein
LIWKLSANFESPKPECVNICAVPEHLSTELPQRGADCVTDMIMRARALGCSRDSSWLRAIHSTQRRRCTSNPDFRTHESGSAADRHELIRAKI